MEFFLEFVVNFIRGPPSQIHNPMFGLGVRGVRQADESPSCVVEVVNVSFVIEIGNRTLPLLEVV